MNTPLAVTNGISNASRIMRHLIPGLRMRGLAIDLILLIKASMGLLVRDYGRGRIKAP
jgi:hypothetical protein